jgi:hypothetical protein
MGRRLDVYLRDGEIEDVRLDGESQWPSWFKIEWKENGQRSAKIRGERLSTNFGDEIVIHQAGTASPAGETPARARRPARRRDSEDLVSVAAPAPSLSQTEPASPDATAKPPVPLVPELTE